jgi:cellobiose transport system permease protein
MTTVTQRPRGTNPDPGTTPRRAWRRRERLVARTLWDASPLTYTALIIAVVLSIFPIVWAFILATNSTSDIIGLPPPLIPGGELSDNLSRVFANEDAKFLSGLMNSVIISSLVTFSVVFTSTLAGFALAKLRFRGSNALMGFILLTMMVPTQLGIIPLYLIMVNFGWENSLQSVAVPFLVQGFGVFMIRQYASSAVPDELIDAARVDGCYTWRVYWNVVLPALRPAATVLALLTFMQTWNDFLWPYVVLTDTRTVQTSLKVLATGNHATDYAQMLTGTAVAIVPLLVMFLIFGRQIIGGIMEGSVKA